jgi:hypothetical protein
MTLAAKPLDLTIYQTRDSALVEACRVAKQSHNKRATLWYRGYRTYLVTEYCERDEHQTEALRIVFADGESVDAVEYGKQLAVAA